jgi:hypothetical protein
MPDSIITPQDLQRDLAEYYRDHYMTVEVAKALKVLSADLQAELDKQIMAKRRYDMARGMEK